MTRAFGLNGETCTAACEATQDCTHCHRRKAPRGRSVALEMTGSLCDDECPGYREEPKPGHLWPGELERYRTSTD